ncbi:MAG: hypothetical protein KDK76_03845 [Chlamydiia bacterium]|nr:hypothetical protein [Chlamydiia bacterium]
MEEISDVCVREPTAFSGYPECEDRFSPYYLYKFVIASGMQFLRQAEWFWAANVMGALLWEPRNAIKAGQDLQVGKGGPFQFFGMNPTELLPWQVGRIPILALHGKNGTQGMFLQMGKYFQEHQIGPLFTVNLAEGELTEADCDTIDQKIEEIKRICRCEKVHLLGYSRGAEIAPYAALERGTYHINNGFCYQSKHWTNWREDIGLIIRIGSMTTQEEWKHFSREMQETIWEIRGLDDIHMPEPSLAIHHIEVSETGHLGLVSSKVVFDHLHSILG